MKRPTIDDRPGAADRLRPRWHVQAGLRAELRATLALATPLAAANLAQMAMGVTNTIMVGRLGAVALAAAGFGAMFFFTIGMILQGVLFAVAPLAAHAYGAGERNAVGRIAGAGIVLAILLTLPFVAALLAVERMLLAIGFAPGLADATGHYLRALAWGAPAFLAFGALRSLFAALSHTRPVMIVLLVCMTVNAVLNWALIFGHLGAPPVGMVGSGYASAVNQWLSLSGLALCAQSVPALARLRLLRGLLAVRRRDLIEILRLGWPIGGVRGIEVGLFLAAGMLIGLFGAAALGAHQLVLNCASISFMVPLGLSQAATVRVARELGAGRPLAARRAGFVAVALGIGFMGAASVVLWAAPQAIIAAYVNVGDPANTGVVRIARQLIVVAAVFQVFDGAQTIAIGALRGYRDTVMPLLLATAGYWGVGFAGGWVLAFPFGCGAVGLWWGLALGLAVVALLLTLRLWLVGRPRRLGPAGEVAAAA
jgi:multidrug resistance protein, MATE family